MLNALILVPLAILILLNLPLGSWLRKASFYAVLALALVQAWFVIFPAPLFVLAGNACPFFPFPIGLDSLTLVMLLSIAIVVFAALLTGWSTISDPDKRFDFANLLILSLIGMNGIVLVRDLFSLYVFLEITAVSSFVLISLHKSRNGLEGAFKYLILSAVATVLMLSAIALLLLTTGSTSFAEVRFALTAPLNNPVGLFAIALFVTGLFIKGGLVPFHGWLPDAYMTAPAGVSVLLAGIVTKTTGVYTLIRLVTGVFGFTPALSNILLVVGTVSILVGAVAAISQNNLKRMLAYSSISQMGYIIAGLAAGTPLGIAGAVFHLFNHAIFKTQLFVNSAAVEQETGTLDMNRLGGLTNRMPATGYTSVVALLSTAGIPPLGGFWSKLIIIIALWTSGHPVYAIIAVLASVLTLAYFLSMQRRVFFGKLAEGFGNLKEARPGIVIPAVILALITVGVGIFFPFILNSFILPVCSILG